MKLIALNKELQQQGNIDMFNSVIWNDRFCSVSDVEICVSVDDPISDFLLEDFYLWRDDSENTMIIEDRQNLSDKENGDQIKITGRDLTSILERRIIWEQTVLKGNFQDGIQKLLNENAISPKITSRKIDKLIFETSSDPTITSLTVDAQFTGDNLYDAIKSLCTDKKIGFKVVLSDDDQFVFKLYSGVDRSYDQIENPYVVFSPKFDNLTSSNYLESKKTFKTVTLVGGEGEGTARTMAVVERLAGIFTGLDRRELFTDAKDLSSKAPGRNLFDSSKLKLGYPSSTGAMVSDPTYPGSRYGEEIKVIGHKDYYISGFSGGLMYAWYDQNGGYSGTSHIVAPCSWPAFVTGTMRPVFYDGITIETANLIQIEEGSTPTAHIAFNTLDATEYNAQLVQRGSAKLSENSITKTFDGQTNSDKNYMFLRDYNLGDLVQFENEYGVASTVRVTEFITSQSSSGISSYPTFKAT